MSNELSIFEAMGGTYRTVDGILYPNISECSDNTLSVTITNVGKYGLIWISYMKEKGLLMVSDSGAIETAVDEVLAANPKTVEEFHSGKEKVLGFLVGQVMKKMKGKADPAKVNELLRKKL